VAVCLHNGLASSEVRVQGMKRQNRASVAKVGPIVLEPLGRDDDVLLLPILISLACLCLIIGFNYPFF